jgi:hypothetical protein
MLPNQKMNLEDFTLLVEGLRYKLEGFVFAKFQARTHL